MPIYVYRCDHCGFEFERLVFRSQDKEEVECPQCGKKGAEKKPAAFATGSSGGSAASSCSTSGGFT